jgi:hypothetical protein
MAQIGCQAEMGPSLSLTCTRLFSRKVVLVQALHDDDDGTVLLVVEAQTRVPAYQSITRRRAGCDIASSALSGSSTTMRSAPRPVSVPPMEVA